MGTYPTNSNGTLQLRLDQPIRGLRAGLFVSMGQGTHIHRKLTDFEFIVVRSGRLAMFEEDHQFDLCAGQALLLWPGRLHGGLRPYETDLSFYWAHFSLPPDHDGQEVSKGDDDGLAFELPQLSESTYPDYQRELLHRYLDERERGTMHPAQASLLLTQILFEAARPAELGTSSEHATSLAGRVEAHIAAHCTQPLNTSSIARAMGYNEDYLGRVFRRALGITITQAIHRSQVKVAKSLLQGSKMNISEVALHCGFNDARYFRRIFHRCEGLSPAAYRQMYSRIHINRY